MAGMRYFDLTGMCILSFVRRTEKGVCEPMQVIGIIDPVQRIATNPHQGFSIKKFPLSEEKFKKFGVVFFKDSEMDLIKSYIEENDRLKEEKGGILIDSALMSELIPREAADKLKTQGTSVEPITIQRIEDLKIKPVITAVEIEKVKL